MPANRKPRNDPFPKCQICKTGRLMRVYQTATFSGWRRVRECRNCGQQYTTFEEVISERKERVRK